MTINNLELDYKKIRQLIFNNKRNHYKTLFVVSNVNLNYDILFNNFKNHCIYPDEIYIKTDLERNLEDIYRIKSYLNLSKTKLYIDILPHNDEEYKLKKEKLLKLFKFDIKKDPLS